MHFIQNHPGKPISYLRYGTMILSRRHPDSAFISSLPHVNRSMPFISVLRAKMKFAVDFPALGNLGNFAFDHR